MASIPFSTFVNVTSATLAPSATFGRLNALCITTTDKKPDKIFEEFSSAQDVVSRFGVGSSQAKYASTFFGYSSKTATSPQKLTFYNWTNNGLPLYIKGGDINDLQNIKVNGSFRTRLNDDIKYTTCDLSNAVNFVDAAEIIKSALLESYPALNINVVYENNSFNVSVNTADDFEFLIDESETFEIFNGDITSAGITLDAPVDIIETGNFIINIEEITSTSTASATLSLKINNNIEIFNKSVDDVKANPLSNQNQITPRNTFDALECSSMSFTPEGYTLNNANIVYTQNSANDLSTRCKLTLEMGATYTPYEEPIDIFKTIDDICVNNGDYVTIGMDENCYRSINIKDDIKGIMAVIKAYALNRYYFVALFSDVDIASMQDEEAEYKWSEVQSLEGLIAIRGTNIDIVAFLQAIIASIDFAAANGAMNINFIDAGQFTPDAITTASELTKVNNDRVNTAYITGGYGQSLTLFGEGHIMGEVFKTLSVALGETYIKAQMEVQGISILNGISLISLRGKSGQGQITNVFSSILNNAVASGIIVQGATLTDSEKTLATASIGSSDIISQLESVGWFLKIDTLTDENIANKTIPVTYIYVANIAVNRIQVRSFLIGA